MAQLKKSPLSIRLSDELLARVQAYADDRQIKRHAAIVEMIEVAAAIVEARPTNEMIADGALKRLSPRAAARTASDEVSQATTALAKTLLERAPEAPAPLKRPTVPYGFLLKKGK